MDEHNPHSANTPGDFYVEDGCCTMCEVPFQEAPTLFDVCNDPRGYQHCFVKRQPQAPEELEQMVMAIRCAELQCIRYRGIDPLIQSRLVEIGEGLVCDKLSTELQRRFDELDAEGKQHRLPPVFLAQFQEPVAVPWAYRIWAWFFRKK